MTNKQPTKNNVTSTPSDSILKENADNVEQTEEEILSTKKQLKKIIREDSNWSLKSISIAGLTGVSVALISTQLTSLVSSLMLIALMAFISATVSEFYRIFVALSTLGAKKVVENAPIQIPLFIAKPGNDEVEVKSVSLDKNVEGPLTRPTRPATKPQDTSDPVTAAISVITQAYRVPDEEAETVGRFKRGLSRVRNYARANPFLMLILLFVGVSLATIGGSYALSNGDPKTIWRTVVVKEEVSEEQKNELLNQAAQEIAPTVSGLASQSDLDLIGAELDSLSGSVESLRLELDKANAGQGDAPIDAKAFESRITELESERADLTSKIAELEARLNELSNAPSEPVAPVPAPVVPTQPSPIIPAQ